MPGATISQRTTCLHAPSYIPYIELFGDGLHTTSSIIAGSFCVIFLCIVSFVTEKKTLAYERERASRTVNRKMSRSTEKKHHAQEQKTLHSREKEHSTPMGVSYA